MQIWQALPEAELWKQLGSDPERGLAAGIAKKRFESDGPNELPEPKSRSIFLILLHQFRSPLIYLLIGAALISFLFGHGKDSFVILFVVAVNAVIGTLQEGKAEASLAALRKLSRFKSRVVRGGEERIVEARELVVGDLIHLFAGDAIPADARVIRAAAFSVAEAALTGESVPVLKRPGVLPESTLLSDRTNMVHAGTWVTSGRASAVVVATGLSNEIGKIAALAERETPRKTHLERKIQGFGRIVAFAAVILFGFVLGVGILRGIPFGEIFMIAVSQMVSLVPEGLPVALTIALAVGVQRMAGQRTIVRKLSAVETLGSTNVICTDKTGTLTRNEMTVVEVWDSVSGKSASVTGIGYAPEGKICGDVSTDLLHALVLCNDSKLEPPGKTGGSIVGDPTEGSLLTLALKAGLDPVSLREKQLRFAEIPFDPETKMMATQHSDSKGECVVYLKGAPEALLRLGENQSARAVATEMAGKALRVLGVARVRGIPIHGERGFAAFQGKIEWLGLVGQIDPPRSEVAAAIQECLVAGIRPVMVTGDHKATALAIAAQLGIPALDAIDGQELESLSDAELDRRIENVGVFSRVHPAQKLRIVKAWQRRGRVVAMTGDGVNDAPALSKADVGVAMGITGTEVAKEAAKIVITDDNFSTIVHAVAEGRLVYQNIKKLILFLFVTSIDEVVVLLLALFLGFSPPLAAVQILWINLVSEGALTLNLIMEPAEGDEMRRTPVSMSEPLFDRALLRRMPLMVISSVISVFGWYLWRGSQGVSPALLQSETFTVLVVCQWFNVLNCRSGTASALSLGLFRNPWLVGGLVLANLLHLLVIYWEPLGRFFHTVPIDPVQFVAIGLVASLVLWTEEARKWWARRRGTAHLG